MSLLSRLRAPMRQKQQHATGHLAVVVSGQEKFRLDQFGRFTLAEGVTPIQVLDTLVGFYTVAEIAAVEAGYSLPILDVIARSKEAAMVKVLH